MTPLYLGLDLGTQGIRAVALDGAGNQVAASRRPLPPPDTQTPTLWREEAVTALRELAASLRQRGLLAGAVSLALTGTSGSLVALDRRESPLLGLLYRSALPEPELRLTRLLSPHPAGHRVDPSFALPRMHEALRTCPGSRRFLSPTDWIAGTLTGVFRTDETLALKMGYDPHRRSWPQSYLERWGIPPETLPEVVPMGTHLGPLRPAAAEETGLPSHLTVVQGLSDGSAGQVAAAAVRPGRLASTWGSTLIFKAVSSTPVADEAGVLYHHRGPDGLFWPGGASMAGLLALPALGGVLPSPEADTAALLLAPSPLLAYPLTGPGERFPVFAADFPGFLDGTASAPLHTYLAVLEGLAFIERLAMERLQAATERKTPLVTTGGGAGSRPLGQLRASVLERPVSRPVHEEPAMGAAVAGAIPTFGSLAAAVEGLVRLEPAIEPDPVLSDRYTERFEDWRGALTRRLGQRWTGMDGSSILS